MNEPTTLTDRSMNKMFLFDHRRNKEQTMAPFTVASHEETGKAAILQVCWLSAKGRTTTRLEFVKMQTMAQAVKELQFDRNRRTLRPKPLGGSQGVKP